jgi:glycerol-3-phosphate dehydrogenase
VFTRNDGLVIIAGGKLTTYRRMARQAVDAAIGLLGELGELENITLKTGATKSDTKQRPLPGAVGLEVAALEGVAAIGRRLMDEHALDVDTATHLCGVYGVRALEIGAAIAANRELGARIDSELPYVWAEVEFAVGKDLARTALDVLARRVPLLLVSRDQGLGVVDRVATIVARMLGRSEDDRRAMVTAYEAEVAVSRRWRGGR